MKYSIITFGCRVNQADSLRLERDLRARGATEAPADGADLVIVNTCSVTASADQGARQTIRRVARMNPSARIVATGCYATRCPSEVADLPGVIHVVHNDRKLDLVAQLGAELEQFAQVDLTTAQRFADGDGACGAPLEPGIAGRTGFTLRVQTGCEERCAYCIIPSTRGASRSLPIDDVVDEVRRAGAAGFKEIALTGVHLGSYGRDLTPSASLLDLLLALESIDDQVRFRISSLEPMDCTPAIVDLVGRSARLLPHFHLPLQHASDRMLDAMRRPYSLGDYRRLVDRIRARLPHASIGSDMIVGFPGESDDDFAANVAYLPSSPLTHLHVFPYSDRPGTTASALPDKVRGSIVRDRAAALRQIGATLAARFRESQTGTLRPGLTLEDGTLVVTDNYLKVRIPAGLPRNQWVTVWIESGSQGALVVTPTSNSRAPGPAISDGMTP